MKNARFGLLRRAASLTLTFCLVVSLTSFAFADESTEPPAPAGDAASPAGDATTGDTVVVIPPEPVPPEDVTPPEPIPPEDATAPGEIVTPAEDVTTGPAANLLLPVLYDGPNHAELAENDTVLKITWDDDGSGGTSMNDNDMKNLLDAVPMPEWNTLTKVELSGAATKITKWNWRTLLEKYSDASDSPPVLDLSGMSDLKTLVELSPSESLSYGLSYLKTVILPTGLTIIGNSAFSNCSTLDPIDLPAGLTAIGNYAFSNCSKLQSVDLSGRTDLTSIGSFAFSNCTSLQSVNFSGCADLSLDSYTFSNCTSLQSVDFSGCTGLTSIFAMFGGCSALVSLDFSGCTKLASINNYAFQDCFSTLQSVNLSGCTNLASIGEKAFYRCTALQSVNLSGCTGLTTINNYAFNSCSSLTSIDLSDCASLTIIDSMGFAGCTALQSVILPAGLTSLKNAAFSGCEKLVSVDFSSCANLTTIESGAFGECSALQSANLSGCAKLTSIGVGAFRSCSSLQSVALPASLTTMGNRVFDSCKKLTSVDFSGCKNLTTLGEAVFYSCDNLDSVNFSGCASLTSFGDWMFTYCPALTSVDFSGCGGLTSFGALEFGGCKKLAKLRLPDNVTAIGERAFYNCVTLADVNLGNIKTIDSQAFRGCAALPDMIFPKNLESIGKQAFTGCSSLHNVYFQGEQAPTLGSPADQVFDVNNTAEGAAAALLYYPKNGTGYQTPNWQWATSDKRMIAYDAPGTISEPNRVQWSKPGENGAPPAYESWETLGFQITAFADDPAAQHQLGDYRISTPTDWQLIPPGSDSPIAMATGVNGTPMVARRSGAIAGVNGTLPAARFSGAIVRGTFPPGGPYVGQLAPSQSRPYGVCTLRVNGSLLIYVGDDYSAATTNGYREFPFFSGSFDTKVKLLPPFTPPPPPLPPETNPPSFIPPSNAEASYLLTVENGTGGGYYQAGNSAPIAARLQAAPSAPGAKFLRWELVSGTGSFADASSPETRFTMAVGDSTVRAVFDTAGAASNPVPTPRPTPTPSPPTGDRGGAGPLAASLLLAAGAVVAARERRRRRGLGNSK